MKYPFAKPLIGREELWAANVAMKRSQLVDGPKNRELEERFADRLGVKHAVAVSSCTTGLSIVWQVGFTQTIPAMSHVATAHAVEIHGGVGPQFFVDDFVWCGQYIDKALNIDTPPGPLPAVYSLYPSKNLTCGGDGGIIATDDSEIAESCRSLRAFGYSDRVGLHYDVDRLGGNFRLSEVHAAIAVEQLKKLDGFQKRRYENGCVLEDDLPLLSADGDYLIEKELVGDLYCLNIYVENRDEVVRKLQDKGIGVSIHYPCPVPLTKYYREKYGYKPGDFPKAEEIARTAISLPIGPHLTVDDMKVIAEAVCASV